MVWTNINKPTTPTYTNVNPMGREQYDQADVEYDESDVYYDGINPNQWSNISKPVSSVWTKVTKPT